MSVKKTIASKGKAVKLVKKTPKATELSLQSKAVPVEEAAVKKIAPDTTTVAPVAEAATAAPVQQLAAASQLATSDATPVAATSVAPASEISTGWLLGGVALLGGIAAAAGGGGGGGSSSNGGGSAPVSKVNGVAIDGYIVGGIVWLVGPDGKRTDTGVKTDANGRFTIDNPKGYAIVVTGGTNQNGVENKLELRAPAGSASGNVVVTPLTTLMAELVDQGKTLAQAETLVEKLFGIDAKVELLKEDPIAGNLLVAQLGGVKLATVLQTLEQNKVAGGQQKLLEELAATLAKPSAGGATDLNTILMEALKKAASSTSTSADKLIAEISKDLNTLDAVKDLGKLDQAQKDALSNNDNLLSPGDTTKPVFTSGASADAAENQNLLYTAKATDNAMVSYSLKGADAELLSIGADGKVTLKSGKLDLEGSKASYSFTVVASDASGNAAEQLVKVSVKNVNDAPTVVANAKVEATIAEDGTVSFTSAELLAKFADVDVGDRLSIQSVTINGQTVTAGTDGKFSYIPATNVSGEQTIVVTVKDAANAEATLSGKLTITAVNDAPTKADDADSQFATLLADFDTEGEALSLAPADLLKLFKDADGDTLSIQTVTVNGMEVSVGSNGNYNIAGALVAGFNGKVTIGVTAKDPSGETASVSKEVTLANDFADSLDFNGIHTEGSAATKDVVTATLSGELEAGDSFTVNGFSVVVGEDGDTLNELALALVDKISQAYAGAGVNVADFFTMGVVDGTITFTAVSLGTDLSGITASASNASASASVSTLTQTATQDGAESVEAQKQSASIALGTNDFQPGEVITVKLDGQNISYTVQAGDTLDVIGAKLVQQIAAANGVNATAAYNADTNTLTFVAKQAGTGFELGVETTEIKTTANTAPDLVEASDAKAAVAQVSTLSFADGYTPKAGDVVELAVGSATLSYTIQAGDTVASIVTGLKAQPLTGYTLGVNGQGQLTITANSAGAADPLGASIGVAGYQSNAVSVETTTAAVQEVAAGNQVSTVTFDLSGGATSGMDAGETFTVTVKDVDYTYTAANSGITLAKVIAGLKFVIDQDDSASVTAAIVDGKLVLTAKVAGTGFDASVTSSDRWGERDNGSVAATTPNQEHVAAKAQVSVLALGNKNYDAGDVVTFTLNGSDYSYTVKAGDTRTDIANALNDLLPADYTGSLDAVGDDGHYFYVQGQPGVAFTFAGSVGNASAAGNIGSVSTTTAGSNAEGAVHELKLAADYDAGDTITLTIGTKTVAYTVTGLQGENIADALKALINGAAAGVTAKVEGGKLLLSETGANVVIDATVVNHGYADNKLTVTPVDAADVNVPSGVTQSQSITIVSDEIDAGDTYTITFAGAGEGGADLIIEYTAGPGESAAQVAENLATLVNAETAPAIATVKDGVITLTARPGQLFSAVAGVTGVTAGTENRLAHDSNTDVSNVAPNKQVSTLVLSGDSFDAGDVLNVTVNGHDYSYTVETQGMSKAEVAAKLAAVLNADIALPFSLGDAFTAAVNVATGNIVLTGKTDSDSFVVGGLTLTDATVESTLAAGAGGGSAANTPKAVEATVTFDDSYDVGDVVKLTVNGTVLTVTVAANTDVAAALKAAIEGMSNCPVNVTRDGNTLTLTEKAQGDGSYANTLTVTDSITEVAGSTLAVKVSTTDNVAGQQTQVAVATVTLAGGDYDAGDTVTVRVNGTDYSVTLTAPADKAAVQTLLLAKLNDATTGLSTPTAKIEGGELVITGYAVDTSLTVTTPVTDVADQLLQFEQAASGNVAGKEATHAFSTFAVAGQLEAGDSVVLTVGGTSYTVNTAGLQGKQVEDELIRQVNADASATVTASYDSVGRLQLTAKQAEAAMPSVNWQFNNYSAHDNDATLATTAAQTAVTAVKEVSTVVFNDSTPLKGDSYSVTIDGKIYTYTVASTSVTMATVVNGLVSKINADLTGGMSALRSANKLVLSGKLAGTDYAITASGSNVDTSAIAAAVTQTTAPVAGQSASAQVSTLDLASGGASYDKGDTVSVSVAGKVYSHTVLSNGVTAGIIAAQLAADITADGAVTATVNENGQLVLTGKQPGVSFTVTDLAVDDAVFTDGFIGYGPGEAGAAAVAEVEVYELANVQVGDKLTVTIDGTDYTVTVTHDQSAGDAAAALLAKINADTLTSGVSASYAAGKLTLTGKADGTSFDASVGKVEQPLTNNSDGAVDTDSNVSAATAQKTVLLLSGEIKAGDKVVFTLNGHEVEVIVGSTDTLDDLGAALEEAVAALEDVVNASYDADTNKLTLTGKADGTAFTASDLAVTKGANVSDQGAPEVNVEQGQAGVERNEEVTETLSGTALTGDVVTVAVKAGDTTKTFKVTAANGDTNAALLGKLASEINADTAFSGKLTATVENGVLKLTAANTSTDIDATLSVVKVTATDNDLSHNSDKDVANDANGTVARATVTIDPRDAGNAIEVGDGFSVKFKLNGVDKTASYYVQDEAAGDDWQTVLGTLADRINDAGDGKLAAKVEAVGGSWQLVIAGKDANVDFELLEAKGTGATVHGNTKPETAQQLQYTVGLGNQPYDVGDELVLQVVSGDKTAVIRHLVTPNDALNGVDLLAKVKAKLDATWGSEAPLSVSLVDNKLVLTGKQPGDVFNVTGTVNNVSEQDNALDVTSGTANVVGKPGSLFSTTLTLSDEGSLEKGDVVKLHFKQGAVDTELSYTVTGSESDLAAAIETAFETALGSKAQLATTQDNGSIKLVFSDDAAFTLEGLVVDGRDGGANDSQDADSVYVPGQAATADTLSFSLGNVLAGHQLKLAFDADGSDLTTDDQHTLMVDVTAGMTATQLAAALQGVWASHDDIGGKIDGVALSVDAGVVTLSGDNFSASLKLVEHNFNIVLV